MNLTADQKSAIALACPNATQQALIRAASNFPNNELVAQTNKYKTDIRANIQLLLTNGAGPFPEPDLADVIATSTVLHLYDGWSYLAEALKASYRGEISVARHVAYYAELRAAMSILASSGIGVFDNRHVVIDSNGTITAIPGKIPTHQMAWLALQEWGGLQSSGIMLGEEVNAFGSTLNEWLRDFQGTATFSLTGTEWITNWGLDLQQFAQDRESRNEVSYRVNYNYISPCKKPRELAPFIHDIWTNTEPGSSPFILLDQFLTRSTIERVYKAKVQAHLGQDYQDRIAKTCRNLNAELYADFLCRKTTPSEPEFLIFASKTSGVHDDFQYLEVVSRAYLLLRIASASTNYLFRQSGISLQNLEFWWKHTGTESGLWPRTTPPDSPIELWDTIDVSLEDLDDWVNSGSNDCWFEAHRDLGASINSLARIELGALWGIA